MPDHPFESLREALLRVGVAPRHVRRTVLELDSHFCQLVQEGLQCGDREEGARIAARELLGTDQALIERYPRQTPQGGRRSRAKMFDSAFDASPFAGSGPPPPGEGRDTRTARPDEEGF